MKKSFDDKETEIINKIISILVKTLTNELKLIKDEEYFINIIEFSLICFVSYMFKRLYESSQLEENSVCLSEYKNHVIKILSASINAIE